MNKVFLLLPAMMLLGACGIKAVPTLPAAPECPDLPESVTMGQPPLEDITDRSMGAMVFREVELTARVGIVQNQRNTAIKMYDECQATTAEYNKEVERLRAEASKRSRR